MLKENWHSRCPHLLLLLYRRFVQCRDEATNVQHSNNVHSFCDGRLDSVITRRVRCRTFAYDCHQSISSSINEISNQQKRESHLLHNLVDHIQSIQPKWTEKVIKRKLIFENIKKHIPFIYITKSKIIVCAKNYLFNSKMCIQTPRAVNGLKI